LDKWNPTTEKLLREGVTKHGKKVASFDLIMEMSSL
jgi:hypothetical protein